MTELCIANATTKEAPVKGALSSGQSIPTPEDHPVNTDEASLNTMSISLSPEADINHTSSDGDDDAGQQHAQPQTAAHSDTPCGGILHRMRRRKNLKSYLTEFTRSKQQCISKKQKLKQLLLDQSNELEYKRAFDVDYSPDAPQFTPVSANTVFPEVSFTEHIRAQGGALALIVNELFHSNNTSHACHVPEDLCTLCCTYTLDLLPGVYEFAGSMDYNGTEEHRSSATFRFGGANECTCKLILNSRAEVVGGFFSENTYKYHITAGSYTYSEPYRIEFTKEYYNYYLKYKVYGQVVRDASHRLMFDAYWKLLDGTRGGKVRMLHVRRDENDEVTSEGDARHQQLGVGDYVFEGSCAHMPNVTRGAECLVRDGQFLECCLTLSQSNVRVSGCVKLSSRQKGMKGNMLWGMLMSGQLDAMEDSEECVGGCVVFEVDGQESEWDVYGGVHVQFTNGYVMDGFFDGWDFMGVWKDHEYKRFGHFQCEKAYDDCDDDCGDDEEDGHAESEEFAADVLRMRSLDSD